MFADFRYGLFAALLLASPLACDLDGVVGDGDDCNDNANGCEQGSGGESGGNCADGLQPDANGVCVCPDGSNPNPNGQCDGDSGGADSGGPGCPDPTVPDANGVCVCPDGSDPNPNGQCDGDETDGDACIPPAELGNDGSCSCPNGEVYDPMLGCNGAICGDGIVQPPEECDDGNLEEDDGCTSLCTLSCLNGGQPNPNGECECPDGTPYDPMQGCNGGFCGDGIVQPPEECDDGNIVDNDGCTNTCMFFCPDGSDPDPNGNCGNGACDPPAMLDANGLCVCPDGTPYDPMVGCNGAICGDGIIQPPEECDDGNLNNNDNCTNLCTIPN